MWLINGESIVKDRPVLAGYLPTQDRLENRVSGDMDGIVDGLILVQEL